MRVLFIVSTKRGYLTLQSLHQHGADIIGVISLQQDKHEVERYEKKISEFTGRLNIPLYETKWLKNKDYPKIDAKMSYKIIINEELLKSLYKDEDLKLLSEKISK